MLFFVFLSLVAMFDLLVWCKRRLSAVTQDVHHPRDSRLGQCSGMTPERYVEYLATVGGGESVVRVSSALDAMMSA
jgi:hypothetical protein